MKGTRWQRALAAAGVLLSLLLTPGQAQAGAREDPPDLRGVQVTEAVKRLVAWNRAVVFSYDPPPDIGLDIDVSDVVVARLDWRTPQASAASARPAVVLILGRRVPNLVGLTREQALKALEHRELRLVTNPGQAPPDWVVRSQRPEADTILEFTPANTVTVALASVTTTPPPAVALPDDPGLSAPVLVVAASSAAGLGLLILFGTLALRRAGRRRVVPALPANIEVRGSPGQLIGPEITEPGSGATVSVRLVPHYDPGTFRLEEDLT